MKPYGLVRLAACLLGLALPLGATGCGPDPENPGDECDPEDGCPNGLVCEKGGDDHICYSPPGTSCEVGGSDYCLGDAVCAEDPFCCDTEWDQVCVELAATACP